MLKLMAVMSSNSLSLFVGKAVSFPAPWVAVPHLGARLALGDVVELCDDYCLPIFTFETDPLVEIIRSYEKFHHAVELRDGRRLSCSYLSLPRVVLLARLSPDFADCLLSAPLSITEG